MIGEERQEDTVRRMWRSAGIFLIKALALTLVVGGIAWLSIW